MIAVMKAKLHKWSLTETYSTGAHWQKIGASHLLPTVSENFTLKGLKIKTLSMAINQNFTLHTHMNQNYSHITIHKYDKTLHLLWQMRREPLKVNIWKRKKIYFFRKVLVPQNSPWTINNAVIKEIHKAQSPFEVGKTIITILVKKDIFFKCSTSHAGASSHWHN